MHCQKWLTSFRSSIDLFIKNEQEDASTLHLVTSAAILRIWWEKIPKKSWKNRWNRSFLMLELSKMAPPSCFPFTWREATLSKSLLTIIYRNKLAIPSAANTFFSGTRSPKSGTPGHSFQNRKNPGHVPENRDGREVCINLRRTSGVAGDPRGTLLVIISKTIWNFFMGFQICLKHLKICHMPKFHKISLISNYVIKG